MKQSEAHFRTQERRGQKAEIHANLLAWSVRGRRGRRQGWAAQRQAKPLPVRWGLGTARIPMQDRDAVTWGMFPDERSEEGSILLS